MMKKMVNGEEVICSEEEETSIRAEWANNIPDPVKLSLQLEADEAQIYLNSTDYRIIRASLEGYTIEQELLDSREAARNKIRAYRNYKP